MSSDGAPPDDPLDRVPCGVLSFGDDGVVRAANATLATMLGHEPGALVGRPVESLLPVPGRIFFQTHLAPLLRLQGRVDEIFLILRARDGSDVGTLLTAVRRADGAAHVTDCALMVVRERQRFEEELLRARRAAEEARDRVAAQKAEVDRANVALEQQAVELELQQQQLQEQATELEAQQVELQRQVAEADALAGRLQGSNDALGRAARELEAILASIGDPFVVYDASWHFRYLNEAARESFRRTGHAPESDASGPTVWELYPSLRGSGFERAMRRAADERTSVEFEEFSPQSGSWTEVRCYAMPDGALAVSWRDVTARRRADEAEHYLGEATAILASSLDYRTTLPAVARLVVPHLADWCAVDLLDDSRAIERVAMAHADPERERELPAGVSDAIPVASVADPGQRATVQALDGHSVIRAPLVARGRTLGVLSLVAAESGRVYGEQDLQLALELARRAALAVDNARLHQATEAARLQAEAANRSKAEFLASMSHELRTPLNAIGGYTELLLLGVRGPINDEQRLDLERIERSQRHLLGVINDILNFARVEAGHVQYEPRALSVAELLAGVEPLVLPQLAAKSLDYQADAGPPELGVHADAERARQILLNLLANAIKFTEPGGRVWASASAEGGAVAIRVHDTGIGIPPDRVSAVFEPFVQVHRSFSQPQEGTGLGLAISRDLARGMGGDLTARSTLGEGSTFTLTLPRAD